MIKRISIIIPLLVSFLSSLSAQTAEQRARELVSKMTLEEKCQLISGKKDGFKTFPVERLGIPEIRMADGPQGVRNDTRSTYYPCGISLASTWNTSLALETGQGEWVSCSLLE